MYGSVCAERFSLRGGGSRIRADARSGMTNVLACTGRRPGEGALLSLPFLGQALSPSVGEAVFVQFFCDKAQSQEFSHVLRWRSLSPKWRTGNFTKGRKLFRCEHVGWIRCHGDIVPRAGRMFKGARGARTVNCTATGAASGMTRGLA